MSIFKSKTGKIVSTILLVLVVAFLYLFVYEPQYKGLISDSGRVLVFAHRGYGNHAPDNSLIGAEIALDNKLDGVDVDAQFTADKEVVIFHDVSLERFTTGTGRVDAKTMDELREYDLAIKYEGEFSDIFISNFEEFVETVLPRGLLMVELKVPGMSDTGIERRVNEIIKKHNGYDQIYISSFNPIVLHRLKKIDSRIKTVFIFMDQGWDPKRVAETRKEDRVALPWYLQTEFTRIAIRKFVKPDALSVNHLVDESVIDKLISKGHPIFLWPVNDEESVNLALKKKPFGLVSDEPLLARELRDQFELESN
jgi:glycerophosphoryl diester phosphodiesterase